MAVEKHKDGTYRIGAMTFATAEQAFAYDSATYQTPEPTIQPPLESMPARAPVSARAVGPSSLSRAIPFFAVLLMAAIAGALYAGPYWTVFRMKAAIQAKDATAFSGYVDFPALKESFKAQLMGKMGNLMKSEGMKENPFAGLGQVIGMGMINQMVDTLVSPAGVMLMMEQGKTTPARPASASPAVETKTAPNFAINNINYSTEEIRSKDGTPGRFLLHGDGLFAWKLSAVEMPL